MIKKIPDRLSETQENNCREMLHPLFKEKQSTEQSLSEANKPELEASDGSIIETRWVPYPMELNHRND